MQLSLRDRALTYSGKPLLTQLSDELHAEPDPLGLGLYLSARASASNSRLTFAAGNIPELSRFTLCHRYEPYWMKPRAGTRLSEVPDETQFFLAELTRGTWLLLVPLLGEPFRFSLRAAKSQDGLELVAETGDAFTPGLGGLALFAAAGTDPFRLLHEGARSVMQRLGTGRLRRDKPLPDFVETFGWCTWDAFYQEVSAEKVREGLECFQKGGVQPRFLILDDGWQSTERRPTGESRLTNFAANSKFPGGLKPTVELSKSEYGVTAFLVWHAIVGYWGGVDGERLPGYGVVDQTRQFGEGILQHAPTFNQQWWGNLLGLVPPGDIARFYDDYHAELRAQGVDGIKVDSQAVLEALAQRQGGRIALTRAYRQALEASASQHFDGRLINCMSNAQETYYGSPDSTLIRTSIDFFPSRPESHGMHLYANAQVGLWFGEFMHPDWDMFQSGHPWGAFHAAGRAISGGPIYVSDKPGLHDFRLLRALTTAEGGVLRCDRPGLPTADCLCRDPTQEPVLLKIWNRNGEGGIVGAFHARSGELAQGEPKLRGTVGVEDVPDLEGEKFVCYAWGKKTVAAVGAGERWEVVLGQGEFELFTLVPVRNGFAAIGLTEKMNSRGAVRAQTHGPDAIEIELRDGGEFLAVSERAPTAVHLDAAAVPFSYAPESGILRVLLTGRGSQRLTLIF